MYGGGPANSVLMLSLVKGNHRMMTQRIRGVGEFLRINMIQRALRVDVVLTIPSQFASVLIGVSYWRAITCEVLSWLQSFVLRFEQVRSPSSYTENFPVTYLQDWQSDTSSLMSCIGKLSNSCRDDALKSSVNTSTPRVFTNNDFTTTVSPHLIFDVFPANSSNGDPISVHGQPSTQSPV